MPPTTTIASRVPGQSGRTRLTARMTATVSSPNATVAGWAPPIPEAICARDFRKPPATGASPRKLGSCLKAMRTAAPALNPRITACETKFRKTPRRASPIPNWISPTTSASSKASSR